jgi:hypothetical protein
MIEREEWEGGGREERGRGGKREGKRGWEGIAVGGNVEDKTD